MTLIEQLTKAIRDDPRSYSQIARASGMNDSTLHDLMDPEVNSTIGTIEKVAWTIGYKVVLVKEG